jgi:hypothetical protein
MSNNLTLLIVHRGSFIGEAEEIKIKNSGYARNYGRGKLEVKGTTNIRGWVEDGEMSLDNTFWRMRLNDGTYLPDSLCFDNLLEEVLDYFIGLEESTGNIF